MGRSFSSTTGKNVVFGSLNAFLQAASLRSADLNAVIQGQLVRTATLDAYTSLFTQYDLSAALNADVASSTLVNGLISYWKMDGDSTDGVGPGSATDTNITYSAPNGKINSGAGLNGTTSKVVIADNAAYKPTNFTISAWVKTSASGAYREIFESYNQSGSPQGFEFRMSTSNKLELVVGDGATFKTVESSQSINTGNFVHVVGTYDGANARLYVNGVADGVVAASVLSFHADNRVRIGVNNYVGATEVYFWNGSIDEVGFWNRALTPTEVTELHNRMVGVQYPFGVTAPTTAGLLGYWTLDGDSSDSLALHSGTDTAISYSVPNGKIGQGAGFNGGTSVIIMSAGITLDSNNWTMAAWFNPVSLTSFRRPISYYGNGPTLYFTSGVIAVVHSGVVDWNTGITISTGVWTHLVITRTGNVFTLYKNGVQSAQSTTLAAVVYTADSSVRLGNSAAFSEPYNGAMDEVGLWSRGLTAAEVTALYNAGSGIQYPF